LPKNQNSQTPIGQTEGITDEQLNAAEYHIAKSLGLEWCEWLMYDPEGALKFVQEVARGFVRGRQLPT
jgi:hypothetical protein